MAGSGPTDVGGAAPRAQHNGALPVLGLREPHPVRRRGVAPTRAFHHFSVGGELSIEDEEVLDETIEAVTCRWCGAAGESIEQLPVGEPDRA